MSSLARIAEQPLTLADYLESTPEGRFEVVDGQLVMPPTPVGPHQRAVARLLLLLHSARPPGTEVLPAPLDWVLWQAPRLQVRQPDLMVVTGEQAAAPRLTTPPLLAVEVLSPDSFERDVITKRHEYARAGLRHYRVVDLDRPEVVVFAGTDLAEFRRASGGDALALHEPFPVTVRPADLV